MIPTFKYHLNPIETSEESEENSTTMETDLSEEEPGLVSKYDLTRSRINSMARNSVLTK